ncbi:MAG: hypothetical protein L6R42_009158, partial [Xanthoria sp. 1 TBL-2021]
DSYSVTRIIDGHPYYLSLTDTAGQEEYRGLWAASNLRSDAFLLVYDITASSSLDTLDYFLSMIAMECEHRQDSGAVQPVKLIAGNKCDLNIERMVTSQRGLEYARARDCGFMETSAREMVNIEETFALIVRRVVAARKAHASQANAASNSLRHSGFANPFKQHAPVSNQQLSSTNATNEKGTGNADFVNSLASKPKKTGFWAKLKCWHGGVHGVAGVCYGTVGRNGIGNAAGWSFLEGLGVLRCWISCCELSGQGYIRRKPRSSVLFACFLGIGGLGIATHNYLGHPLLTSAFAEAPPAPVDVKIEKTKKKKGLSKEENRETISSQHLQVKRSWENPGVYAWGSNSGRVVAPDSDEQIIRTPRRIAFFDGLLLRDMKLDRNFGAAITENGDLLQWGNGFSTDVRQPTATLKGKNLKSLTISRDRVLALGSDGTVYSVPGAKEDQEKGKKVSESSWIPFLSYNSTISYRRLQPKNLAWNEKVKSIASGAEHLLILTSAGRLFTAASSSEEFPARGQMGIPGLVWTTRPAGPYDQPHEVSTLRGFEIAAIAAGDYHSLALDREGRVFAFGDNSSGQLGFDPTNESTYVDAPSLIPIQQLYTNTGLAPT